MDLLLPTNMDFIHDSFSPVEPYVTAEPGVALSSLSLRRSLPGDLADETETVDAKAPQRQSLELTSLVASQTPVKHSDVLPVPAPKAEAAAVTLFSDSTELNSEVCHL